MECGEPRNSHEFLVWKRIFGNTTPLANPWRSGPRQVGGRGTDVRRSTPSRRHPSPRSFNDGIDDKRLFHRRRTFREGAFVLAARLLMGATGEL